MLVGEFVTEVLTSQITLARVRLTNKQTTTKTKQNMNQDKEQCHLNPTWEAYRWETSLTPAIGRDFPLWDEGKSYNQWMEKRRLGAVGFGLSKVMTKIQDSHRTIWHPIFLSPSRSGACSAGLVSWAMFQTVPCFVLFHFQMELLWRFFLVWFYMGIMRRENPRKTLSTVSLSSALHLTSSLTRQPRTWWESLHTIILSVSAQHLSRNGKIIKLYVLCSK